MFQKLWPFNSATPQGGSSLNNGPLDHGVSTKVKPVHASFNKGVPLNMKVIIRGDIRTGKTSVFERLQGLPFRHEGQYRTTEQIQVANIPWQYIHTQDIIKVEIWDVVDRGIQAGELKPNSSKPLKIDNSTSASPPTKPGTTDSAPHAAFALDASTIDVYRNTDGVILIYDISKAWTFDYVEKALEEIPASTPVLILSNFTDNSAPRPVVNFDRVEALMRQHNEERARLPCSPANLIRQLDTSMKTGLGLKEIHEYFGIPFLNVLRETHRKQFEQKTLEIMSLLKTLDGNSHIRPQLQQSQQPLHQDTSSSQSSYTYTANKAPTALASSSSSSVPLASSPSASAPLISASSQLGRGSKKQSSAIPAPIQTSVTQPPLHQPKPQTSTPNSPARKTRNEHTNVEIVSPKPFSAQAPPVLFDFNTGKLEEGFFQNVDLDSTKSNGHDEHSTLSEPQVRGNNAVKSFEPLKDERDADEGNPMVAEDEDINEEEEEELSKIQNRNNLAVATMPNIPMPNWTSDSVESDMVTQHSVFGSKQQSRVEELRDSSLDDPYGKSIFKDHEEMDRGVEDAFDGRGSFAQGDRTSDDYQQESNRSSSSIADAYPSFPHQIQEDSDLESQTDFPVASAMYYENGEPGFVEEEEEDGEEKKEATSRRSMLSSYAEMGDHTEANPWGSSSDLLHGTPATVAMGFQDTILQRSDVSKVDPFPSVSGPNSGASNGMTTEDADEAISLPTTLTTELSPIVEADTAAEESSPALSMVSSEGRGIVLQLGEVVQQSRDRDSESDDEKEPRSGGGSTEEINMTPTTPVESEKKKTKRKGKKKGKKAK
ncbi:hypothetical protein BGW38_000599 [Lunasporangiospora selenospora]|uniref:Uncharacterized protein n=1 Tax=Lunasporangiospora selenospora TaxID=979761 RepID=A0A9P6FV94_9FUNG|nr:hypothetical protein BGW38_000599 [Lunasporangiospora selenospora]